MAISLLYHDVVPPGRDDASGFPGPGAAPYKLTADEFVAHMAAVAGTGAAPRLTFDDGGVSGIDPVADVLERHGWRGHFFVTTDWVGAPGFLDAGQIRELRRRGHVIGSHSCSHPERMSSCGRDRLLDEWRRSCAALGEILGEEVTEASVPGGYYSRAVAEAAAEAGVRTLFTSEPTAATWRVGGCVVVGRYTVYRGMSAGQSAALAAGRRLARWRQALWWNVKKAAKAIGGRAYLALRGKVLARAYPAEARGDGTAAR